MKTILVADDEYALLDAVEMILRFGGVPRRHRLERGGGDRVIEKTKLDLIILDVMMPEYGRLRRAAADPRPDMRGNLPVIMMSGTYPDEKQKELGWSTGWTSRFIFDDC